MNDNMYDKERHEQEANKEASRKMAANDQKQTEEYQKTQNSLTRSEDADKSNNSLLNKKGTERGDSVSVKEQNKEKLKSQQDEDFGIE